MCDDKQQQQQRSQKLVVVNGGVGCGQSAAVHIVNGCGGGGVVAADGGSNYTISLEQSMEIIDQQRREIYELRSQLNSVMNERDALLGEISRLKFDMELYDQRATLQDPRYWNYIRLYSFDEITRANRILRTEKIVNVFLTTISLIRS